MIVIAADIGNSATKFAIGSNDFPACPAEHLTVVDDDFPSIAVELPQTATFWTLCSVNVARCVALKKWIANKRPNDTVHEIQADEIPLESKLENRSATGRDRLIAACAAANLTRQDCATIVVDAGTAVTIDLVDANQVFRGGVIFPGATASLSSLSAAASALPNLAESHRDVDLEAVMSAIIGTDTQQAMLRGVYHSQLAAMKEIVQSISTLQPQPCEVFATGGGVERLREFLPCDWRLVPNLVLQGTFEIGRQLAKRKMVGQ